MPTSNIPSLGGFNNNTGHTPIMDVRSGGILNVNAGVGSIGGFVTQGNGSSRTLLTVGDGIGGGSENVTLNVSLNGQLNRHPGGNSVHNFLVNADGFLNFTSNVDFNLSTNRFATFDLAGGSVVIAGTVTDLDNFAANFVDFTAPGSSFTANFGSDFPDFAAVLAQIGAGLSFRSSTALALSAVDNGGSFTVSSPAASGVPEPSSVALMATLMAGLTFLRRRKQIAA